MIRDMFVGGNVGGVLLCVTKQKGWWGSCGEREKKNKRRRRTRRAEKTGVANVTQVSYHVPSKVS